MTCAVLCPTRPLDGVSCWKNIENSQVVVWWCFASLKLPCLSTFLGYGMWGSITRSVNQQCTFRWVSMQILVKAGSRRLTEIWAQNRRTYCICNRIGKLFKNNTSIKLLTWFWEPLPPYLKAINHFEGIKTYFPENDKPFYQLRAYRKPWHQSGTNLAPIWHRAASTPPAFGSCRLRSSVARCRGSTPAQATPWSQNGLLSWIILYPLVI